jgi:hypothetical protein
LFAVLQAEHIEGSIAVPMFRVTAGTGKWDNVKKVRSGTYRSIC